MSAASDLNKSAALKRRKVLAGFFRHHRLKAGLDLAQVAEALELENVETVRAYEAGELDWPLEDLFTLSNLFNIPPDDVVALIFEVSRRQERT